MKTAIKKACLVIYYSIAVHFPTQPMAGYRLGYALRRFLLKYIAEACGRDVVVKKGCYFGSGIGLRVGDRSQLGQNAMIGRCVTLGDDVLMGPDVVIMTDAHNFDDLTKPINQQGNVGVRPVVIGDDVWIGTRAIIMPGTTVGSKAVIGAGTIVTHDVPGGAIVAGVPGKVLRYRGERTPAGD